MLLIKYLTAIEKEIKLSSLNDKEGAFNAYMSAVSGKSNAVARAVAADILGKEVFWDWDGEDLLTIGLNCADSWH